MSDSRMSKGAVDDLLHPGCFVRLQSQEVQAELRRIDTQAGAILDPGALEKTVARHKLVPAVMTHTESKKPTMLMPGQMKEEPKREFDSILLCMGYLSPAERTILVSNSIIGCLIHRDSEDMKKCVHYIIHSTRRTLNRIHYCLNIPEGKADFELSEKVRDTIRYRLKVFVGSLVWPILQTIIAVGGHLASGVIKENGKYHTLVDYVLRHGYLAAHGYSCPPDSVPTLGLPPHPGIISIGGSPKIDHQLKAILFSHSIQGGIHEWTRAPDVCVGTDAEHTHPGVSMPLGMYIPLLHSESD